MTVSSLWKALDRADCGKSVGSKALQEHHSFPKRTNPWNVNDKRDPKFPTLAVDLSIWICEALTCSAFEKSKNDPSLHLVYTRTVKLLSMGIKLVMVIEGKRRTRHQDGEDSFRKRRSGTYFWNACQRCEQMLHLLGVPVVRAKAEGEALCALLNDKGIVDGVISNDGDCFLYGAKVLYTKFTLDNLEKKMVMRYDASDIRACVDDDDGNEYDNEREPREIVSLDRSDLIAFAILTGSDAVGAGLPKVGCRKAIRFIKKCQLDNPLKRKDAAINELKSWAKAAAITKANPVDCNLGDSPVKAKQTCSCCGHLGTKARHQKYGCELCGTGPGESCFVLSPGAKFRSALRKKAMCMEVDFDPESVVKVYQNPNDNQIPLPLLGKSSTNLQMTHPNFQGFQEFPMVIRGQNLFESRQFLKQSLSSLMARNELLKTTTCENTMTTTSRKLPSNKTRPEPRTINKTMVRGGNPSFEVEWIVNATVTDAEGNPMDEFVFCTIEDQHMVKRRYPKEKERAKQGDAEQEKRRAFLQLLSAGCDPNVEYKQRAEARKAAGRCFQEDRRDSFGVSEPTETRKDDKHTDPMDMEISFIKYHGDTKAKLMSRGQSERKQEIWGDDADKLLRFVGLNGKKKKKTQDDGCTSMCSDVDSIATTDQQERYAHISIRSSSLTPGHLHFLGTNRKVKYPTGDSIFSSKECRTSLKENHLPKDIQSSLPSIQSITCLKQCCTSNKELARNSCLADESTVGVLCNHNHHVPVQKSRNPCFLDAPNSCTDKQNRASHYRSAPYHRDAGYSNDKGLFQRDELQRMDYESLGCNQNFYMDDNDGIFGNRANNFVDGQKPKFPCNDDYLMQSPHRSKILHPQEEYTDLEPPQYDTLSVSREYDIPLHGKRRFEIRNTGSKQFDHAYQSSDWEDLLPEKKQKIECDHWDTNKHFNEAKTSDRHRVYHLREAKVSRPTRWEESDCTRVPQDSRNDNLFIFSFHRRDENAEFNHSSIRVNSEFHSLDKWDTKKYFNKAKTSGRHKVHHFREAKVSRPTSWEELDCTRVPRDPRNDDFLMCSFRREDEKIEYNYSNIRANSELHSFWQNEIDNSSHCHSIDSFMPHQVFQYKESVQQFSHGKSALNPIGDNQCKVADERFLEDAVAEKLRIKTHQAALDAECRQFLAGTS